MNVRVKASLVLVFAFSASVFARTAADIKADLVSIARSGKEVRIAYVKGGPPQNFNKATKSGIYVASSLDGIIRKIYPKGDTVGDYACVNITDDGKRVIFYDYGRKKTIVAKFDGSGVTSFATPELFDYYRDKTAGTDWAVVKENTSPVYRINVDATSTIINITTMLTDIDIHDGGCLVSDDLTTIVCTKQFGNSESVGMLNTTTGSFVKTVGGCWPQMRSGTPIQVSQNDGTQSPNHWGPTLFDANGSKVQVFATSATLQTYINEKPTVRKIQGTCWHPEVEFATDGHRWSRDSDYFSFTCQMSNLGPIIWRTTDSKWIYVEDGLGCQFAGDLDMVFVSPTGVAKSNNVAPAYVKGHAKQTDYAINGKRIIRSAVQNGIVIRAVEQDGSHGTLHIK